MTEIWIALIAIYLFLNLRGFFLMYGDKKKAKSKGSRRIPEKNLIWTAALFGALGVWVAMSIFRHKTQKRKFVLFVPLLFILQGVLITILGLEWGL